MNLIRSPATNWVPLTGHISCHGVHATETTSKPCSRYSVAYFMTCFCLARSQLIITQIGLSIGLSSFMVAGSALSLILSLLMYCIFLVMSCVCALRSSATIATGAHDSSGRNDDFPLLLSPILPWFTANDTAFFKALIFRITGLIKK
ncbi:unnamed protein product [Spodoptera exigua]|nr:unnamed protein product [Spodoptera exigua]